MQALYGWADTPELIKFLLDAYYLVFVTVRNGLFEGFFYVAIGMFIGFNWGMQRTWRPVITYACLFAGLFGCITISSSAHLPFCAMFALSLFMLCIRRVGKASHPWARKASTVVYLVHMVFVIIFVYGIYGFTETSFLSADIPHTMLYIFALSCSLLVAAIVIPASRKSAMLKTVFGV